MTSATRTVLLLLPLALAACAGTPSSTSPTGDEGEILNDAEVTQELTGRPSYTLRSRTPLGLYTSNEYCPGGFDVCDRIEVKKVDGKVKVLLGWDGHTVAEAWASRGVLLFSTGEMSGDCDDPGCGNMIKITGVIYPVKDGDRWVPQVKATYLADFPFPDEVDAPEGEVRTVIKMRKEAP